MNINSDLDYFEKIFYILISVLILSIISFVIYWNLPFEVTRKADIDLGNTLIENINSYKSKYNEIPATDDWKTLEKLGFKIEMLGTKPNYENNQNNEYELVFLEGFDGPYLMWNSKEKKWKIGFPTIFTNANKEEDYSEQKRINQKINGNTVIFLRPSDEKFENLKGEQGIYEVDSDFGFAIQRTIDSLQNNPKFKAIKNEVYTERYIEIEDCRDCPKSIDRNSIYYGLILTAPNKEIKIIPNVQTLNYIQIIEEYFK
jgi:hypothetical protein